LDKSRVGSIGWPSSFQGLDLNSSTNLSEFDTIIFFPQAQQANAKTDGRLAQLGIWVSEGHSLIVLVNSILSIGGSNLPPLDLTKRFPLNLIRLTEVSGSRVEPCGSNTANSILANFCSDIGYDVTITGGGLSPLLQVTPARSGPTQIVGGYAKHNRGLVVFVPPYRQDSVRYADSLLALLDVLRDGDKVEWPDWAGNLWTATEASAHGVISAARTEIDKLKVRISEEEAKISSAMQSKELLFATGDQFCNAVVLAFEELGICVINGPHTRADILGLDGSTIVAIEAKGLEGSARESHLRQVDTWVAEVRQTLSSTASEREEHPTLRDYAPKLEELGVNVNEAQELECKGIMVIGTFRLTPVPERDEEKDFPGLNSKITLSRVCALSGLQLYNLVMLARARPEEKEKIRTALLNTDGILGLGKGWQSHLTKIASE
jgi:hypothetical protein